MAKRKQDKSTKRRLADNEGTLWLEMQHDERLLDGKDPDEIIDEIVAYAKKNKIGKYDGRSQGSRAFDVSFYVKNREAGAVVLRELMENRFPRLNFTLGDEYESKFHKEMEEESLLEQVRRLEMTAGYFVMALGKVREELECLRSSDSSEKPRRWMLTICSSRRRK